MAIWDLLSDEFFTFILNANTYDRTNIKTAEGIDHSLVKLDYSDYYAKMVNNTTNAGGGRAYISP